MAAHSDPRVTRATAPAPVVGRVTAPAAGVADPDALADVVADFEASLPAVLADHEAALVPREASQPGQTGANGANRHNHSRRGVEARSGAS